LFVLLSFVSGLTTFWFVVPVAFASGVAVTKCMARKFATEQRTRWYLIAAQLLIVGASVLLGGAFYEMSWDGL